MQTIGLFLFFDLSEKPQFTDPQIKGKLLFINNSRRSLIIVFIQIENIKRTQENIYFCRKEKQ